MNFSKVPAQSAKVRFLIRTRGQVNKAHIWKDPDTLCRMWSTGGMYHHPGRYRLCETPEGRDICTMCLNVASPVEIKEP